jgi:hypothetical protein
LAPFSPKFDKNSYYIRGMTIQEALDQLTALGHVVQRRAKPMERNGGGWAQQTSVQPPKSSTLEVQDYSLEANSFIDALLKISVQFRLPLGVEWVRTEDLLKPIRFSWSHATATDVVQSVVSVQAGYDWRTEDNVVHVFKRDLVEDNRNPLNITIESFDEQPETVAWADNDLYQMVSHVVRHPELQGITGSVLGSPGEPVFRFAAQNVTARSILNKIVTAGLLAPAARMDRIWIVTFPQTPILSRTGFLEVVPMWNPKFVSDDTQPFWILIPWGDPPLENMVR